MKKVFLFVLAVFAIAFYGDIHTQQTLVPEAHASVTSTPTTVSVSRIIALVNEDRAMVRLQLVKENSTLNNVAQSKAERYANADHSGHADIDGSMIWTHLRAAGYNYRYAGENLARISSTLTSEYIIEKWEQSPDHYKNIVFPDFDEIGIGIAYGMHEGVKAVWVVQLFGKL